MVGAVLVQRTKWRNVEHAIEKLRSSGLLDPKRMRTQSVERLTTYIHSCGFFQTKARQLNALCAYFSRHDDDVSRMRDINSTLREELESVRGIGPETADAIMLYAVGLPTFVVDTYTRRIFDRLGEPSATAPYPVFRSWLLAGVKADAKILGEYHALLVCHGREICTKRMPDCGACSLCDFCPSANKSFYE